MMCRLAVIAASDRRAQPLGPRCRSQALITALLSPARRYQAARRERNFSTHTQIKRARRQPCTRREVAMMKTWFNVSEAADYAGVSRDTIYTACERHELRSARLSGRRAIRIRPQWVDAWLEQHAAGGGQHSSGNTPSGVVS